MTIILALGNRQQVIQLSDRRLSRNGRLVDDESNKSGILFCPDARLAFGYTGLARYGSFKTIDWLLHALHDAGPPTFLVHDVMEKLKANATRTFREHPALKAAPREAKKLSLMFSGYVYLRSGPQQGYALLSIYVNWQTGYQFESTQDDFNILYSTEIDVASNPTFIQRIGNWHGISEKDILAFRQLLVEGRPSEGIVNIAVDYLRELADRPSSANCIGKQLSAILLPSDAQQPVEMSYHSAVIEKSAYMPAQVFLFPEKHAAISGVSISPVDDDTPAISVP
ncbi:hypothetical protein [Thiocapsa sp.]|uniref:hypothetical protein n=1 Tax=Thiocapsa sp. TaxID=2024551 RepID=UPI0035944D44